MSPQPKPLPKFAILVTIAVTVFVASTAVLRAVDDYQAHRSSDRVRTTLSAPTKSAGALLSIQAR
jgi:hypothetical protein